MLRAARQLGPWALAVGVAAALRPPAALGLGALTAGRQALFCRGSATPLPALMNGSRSSGGERGAVTARPAVADTRVSLTAAETAVTGNRRGARPL